MDKFHTAPVAIVGAGPVGLMLALFLNRYGVRVVIFDGEHKARAHPKGSTHNSRTMEHYRSVGIAEEIRKLGLPLDHPRDIAYFTRLYGHELARFVLPSERQRMQQVSQTPETDQTPEPLLRANQMYVEQHLREHVRQCEQITFREGWLVTDFVQYDAGICIKTEEVGSGASEYWRSEYMVGCDGGQSFVRRKLGIHYLGQNNAGSGFLAGRMISTYIRIPMLYHDILPENRAWMYNVMAPELRMLLISLNGSDEFLLMSKAAEPDEQPDDADIIRRIQAGVGAKVQVDILAHAAWNGGMALVAERFSDRRVFLAGDAIHLFSPTGGFGMNTGIDGAANLAWKIAAAVQGWAGDRLLASYETERRPVAHRNTTAARFLTQRVGNLTVPEHIEHASQEGQLAREQFGLRLQEFRGQFTSLGVELGARYDASPIIWADGEPPEDDPLHYHPSDVPGGRLPHLWINTEGKGRQSLFDLLHHGFTLLRIGATPPSVERFVAAARMRGIPLKVVDVASNAAKQLYRQRLILVRPDQYIAWRGPDLATDPHVILDRIVGCSSEVQPASGDQESMYVVEN